MAEQAGLKGRLLVAAPSLLDPNFARTVILVLDHDDGGAVGVVLNRPSKTPVAEVLGSWSTAAAEPAVVFLGGPVQPEAAVCLARPSPDAGGAPGLQPLLGWAGSLDLDQDPVGVVAAIDELRVFAGYAGWSPGQLEAEVGDDDWFVVDALPADAFGGTPDDLWRRVLRRQRGPLRLVAEFPLHPSFN